MLYGSVEIPFLGNHFSEKAERLRKPAI